MILALTGLSDPMLEWPAEVVTTFDEGLRRQVSDLLETLMASEGAGLAAPQVGISRRIVVARVAGLPPVLINPVIVYEGDETVVEREGCLSLGRFSAKVERANQVRLVAVDVDGEELPLELSGLTARVAQHEIDHLNGILIFKHLSLLKRGLITRRRRAWLRSLRHVTPSSRGNYAVHS